MSEIMIQDTGIFARAELDVQISTARAYPRDKNTFVNRSIELVTMDQKIAESCFYSLIRNGKDGKSEIRGPSIRLAEIVASCWGNIHSASRIIENDGKFITAQGVSWDLEANNKISREFKRKITGRDGRTFSEDMQVVTGNAACAIALRNAILEIVPRPLVDKVYDAAVLCAIGDQKNLETRRKTVFDRFNKMGIETQKIFKFFNKQSINDFNAEDITDLIGIGTSIKDGLLSIDKAFNLGESEYNAEDRIKNLIDNK